MDDPEKITGWVDKLVHKAWSTILFTVGVGFTTIEKFIGIPLQVFEMGVTKILAEMGKLELLMAENGLIFPVPEVERPIPAFEFVHW